MAHAKKEGNNNGGGGDGGGIGNYSLRDDGVRAYAPWTLRGAADDWFILDFPDGWLFPHGSNRWARCVVLTSGEVWDTTRGSNRVAAVGRQMSAVPDESVFTYGLTESNSYLMVWDNFFLSRDTNQPVTASIELFRNGNWIARSNEVEIVHRRVNPEDWDDDGIPNWYDAEPLVWNGDNFGPHQTLTDGANSNAYCWVDLVSQADAWIEFAGDGASDLADPCFIAKAGETNRVTLLIGKTYRATSTMPIAVVNRSSAAIAVRQEAVNELRINWPVTIAAETLAWDANSFNMQVSSDGLGGGFVWTNYCCSVSGSVGTFTYGCNGRCYCTGCAARGYFQYEGYRLPATGGYCGCLVNDDLHHGEHEDEEPVAVGVSVSFMKPVIFFEDEYTNTVSDIVPWRSTETKLVCNAFGGETGGVVRVEIVGADDLIQYGGQPLPLTRNLAAGESLCFTNTYRAISPSGCEDAIQVTGTFMEYGTEWYMSSIDHATAIKVQFKAKAEAFDNKCEGRHKLGVREKVICTKQPSTPRVSWVCSNGGFMSQEKGEDIFNCPLDAAINPLKVQYGGAEYVPNLTVVEPCGIEVLGMEEMTYDIPVNHAGGIGMRLSSYVYPLDVSFCEVEIAEVPNNYSERDGYFALQWFHNMWVHNEDMGAGKWGTPDEDNFCGTDVAAIGFDLPRITANGQFTTDPQCGWINGRLVWATPSGWREQKVGEDDPPVHKQFDTSGQQIFTINQLGTVEIHKLGKSVRRDINNDIYLNGIKIGD